MDKNDGNATNENRRVRTGGALLSFRRSWFWPVLSAFFLILLVFPDFRCQLSALLVRVVFASGIVEVEVLERFSSPSAEIDVVVWQTHTFLEPTNWNVSFHPSNESFVPDCDNFPILTGIDSPEFSVEWETNKIVHVRLSDVNWQPRIYSNVWPQNERRDQQIWIQYEFNSRTK